MSQFTPEQENQILSRGNSLEDVSSQLALFRKGIKPVELYKPAVPGDGIEVYSDADTEDYIRTFDNGCSDVTLAKFIPASGAASRMFKALFEGLDKLKADPENQERALNEIPELKHFFSEIDHFPFYSDLQEISKMNDLDLGELLREKKYFQIIELLLNQTGLNYGSLPKGLLKFHTYGNRQRTAVHEHLIEAAQYLAVRNKINLHFTVSPEHRRSFEELTGGLTPLTLDGKEYIFDITFSEQKPSTDTIAVTMNNDPFITSEGLLLFRPGGHGALLENLMEIRKSVVFIGNIDNVSPDNMKPLRIKYKKLTGGILLQRRSQINSFLQRLDNGLSAELKNEITDFVKKYISPGDSSRLTVLSDAAFKKEARHLLNRPVRVCGMVKNTGEPGGGPFWIRYNGTISKQIVESSQIDLQNSEQKNIFNSSTHFNPVDMACSLTDYNGNKFNLNDFKNPEMAFIAVKSYGAEKIKALELPGLWNGSMSEWITFFVEVPGETFSPVKTVFDLVRPEHR